MRLEIAEGFSLSVDYATKTAGILAQRRKGKSYLAMVIAEELAAAGIPWTAIDPTGAWYGMRSGADGKAKGGIAVVVLGGQHGDLPLDRSNGQLVADLVVDHPGWYILDLSAFESKEAERQFVTAFAQRLYRRKAIADFAMHLFLDEADIFVSQSAEKGDKLMLSAFEALVRRGGIRGIGTTLISQRAAVVHKNVLEQLDILFALRATGPNDQSAIKRFVSAQATPEQLAQMMGSLASLDIGDAWVWEPGEDIFQRIHVRLRRTFNSSSTPKAGQQRVEPKMMTQIDLHAVELAMKESIDKAKADDPKFLHLRIRELEAELRKVPAPAPAQTKVVEKRIPFVPPELKQLAHDILAKSIDMSELASNFLTTVALTKPPAPTTQESAKDLPSPIQAAPARTEPVKNPPNPTKPTPPGAPKGLRRDILSVCAQFPDGIERPKLALLANTSPGNGHLSNLVGQMRSEGLLEPGWPLRATAAGLQAVDGLWEPIPTGQQALDYWIDHFGREALAGRILQVLSDGQPRGREELAAAAGSEKSSGHFSNTLGPLRTAGLVAKGTPLRLTPDFLAVIQGA